MYLALYGRLIEVKTTEELLLDDEKVSPPVNRGLMDVQL